MTLKISSVAYADSLRARGQNEKGHHCVQVYCCGKGSFLLYGHTRLAPSLTRGRHGQTTGTPRLTRGPPGVTWVKTLAHETILKQKLKIQFCFFCFFPLCSPLSSTSLIASFSSLFWFYGLKPLFCSLSRLSWLQQAAFSQGKALKINYTYPVQHQPTNCQG